MIAASLLGLDDQSRPFCRDLGADTGSGNAAADNDDLEIHIGWLRIGKPHRLEVGTMFNGPFTEILLAGLAALLIVAAVIDVRTFTISNRLNLTVALLAPVYWLSVAMSPWPGVALQLAAGLTVFTILAGAFYAGMMGGGDVKLAAALALWFPPLVTVKFLVLMSLAGGALTLVVLVWHRARKREGRPQIP